jgi:protein-tyrosine-phosphatase
MTGKYFFNSIGAVHAGSLTYNEIEKSGDILNHPSAISDARGKASELLLSLSKRKRVIFICSGNAGRSQMSAAFAQIRAGDRLEVISGGSSPANEISSVMQQVMAEKGIDMAFRKPMSIVNALGGKPVDCAVTMGCGVSCPVLPGAEIIQWDLPDPRGKPVEFMRVLRDEIEKKVIDLVGKL